MVPMQDVVPAELPQSTTVPWAQVDKCVDIGSRDADLWWRMTGPILGVLMKEAGYDLQSQYLGLMFHIRHIIHHLGPAPRRDGTNMLWKSFMTDDFSPLEYSWQWDSSKGPPMIRYCIEAIGPAAGSAKDIFNQASALELCNQLDVTCPGIDWGWFKLFHSAFCDHARICQCNETEKNGYSSPSSLFLGFELGKRSIAAKAYFLPVKAEQCGVSRLSVLTDAIELLKRDYGAFTAYDQFLDFTNTPQGSALDIVGVAIDCVSPAKARLKLYVRSPRTSFESVCEMMSLGGRVNALTQASRKELKELWRLTLGLEEGFAENEELKSKDHQTAGVLYNFDIKADYALPEPKLYIPVKHYAPNDLAAAQGLCEYLRSRGRANYVPNYMRALERACTHRNLRDDRGFQTYIGTAVQKNGSLALCSYWNGEFYHPDRWT